MNTELAALCGLAAFILALSMLAAFLWLRERRAKREAMRRAYAHGLSREAARRSGARHGHGGRGGASSSSSSSNSDGVYPGAFAFPGLGDSDGGRSDHSDASSSHSSSSCSSSSCSSSSCGGGGGD